LTGFSKDVFVETTECQWLTRFWLKQGWIGDVSNFADTKRDHVSDFFSKWDSFRVRGVRWFVCDV
jgi:hypothetical protein